MNFFQQQDRARRKSAILVFGFFLSIAAIIGCLDLAIIYSSIDPLIKTNIHYINLLVFIAICYGSIAKYIQLRNGGLSIIELMQAKQIHRDDTTPQIQVLINVVDEIAIASGITAPGIYLLEKEAGINAFVAGYNPNDTVLVVTKGALDNLSRDELQGVIAHEYSHIFNSDTTLNLRLLIVLGGLLSLSNMGFQLIRVRDKKGQVVLIGAMVLAIGYVGLIFGSVLRAAISRQRESLADASAVQFTRNPPGITCALLKIQRQGKRAFLNNTRAEEVSHMCFSKAQKTDFLGLMATHPKLEARINELDPTGEITAGFNQVITSQPITSEKQTKKNKSLEDILTLTTLPAAALLSSIGNPTAKSFALAGSMLQAIPDKLKNMLADHNSAQALIYAILLIEDSNYDYSAMDITAEVKTLIPTFLIMSEIKNRSYRLMLLDLAIPTLKQLDQLQIDRFVQNMYTLVKADNRLSLLEVAEITIITQRLLPDAYKHLKLRYNNTRAIRNQIVYILGFLAKQGSTDIKEQQQAFITSIIYLSININENIATIEITIQELISSLKILRLMTPQLKQRFLEACLICINKDNQVSIGEAEILRAICACLDCPMPPFTNMKETDILPT